MTGSNIEDIVDKLIKVIPWKYEKRPHVVKVLEHIRVQGSMSSLMDIDMWFEEIGFTIKSIFPDLDSETRSKILFILRPEERVYVLSDSTSSTTGSNEGVS